MGSNQSGLSRALDNTDAGESVNVEAVAPWSDADRTSTASEESQLKSLRTDQRKIERAREERSESRAN